MSPHTSESHRQGDISRAGLLSRIAYPRRRDTTCIAPQRTSAAMGDREPGRVCRQALCSVPCMSPSVASFTTLPVCRCRERNPDKVKENNRRPRHRLYDPAKAKAWREKRLADPAYRARMNREANERATAIRQWLNTYKLKHGCVDCGYKEHAVALHFDHIKGTKTLNVCNAKSISQAKAEIRKCVVRCANCHAIKSFQDLQVRKLE